MGQDRITKEGNYLVTYQRICLLDGIWGDWELIQREPFSLSLRKQYDRYLRSYTRYPNQGRVFYDGDFSLLKMGAVSEGRVSPCEWSTDGKSILILHICYGIIGYLN
jgi:hypothetical protein